VYTLSNYKATMNKFLFQNDIGLQLPTNNIQTNNNLPTTLV